MEKSEKFDGDRNVPDNAPQKRHIVYRIIDFGIAIIIGLFIPFFIYLIYSSVSKPNTTIIFSKDLEPLKSMSTLELDKKVEEIEKEQQEINNFIIDNPEKVLSLTLMREKLEGIESDLAEVREAIKFTNSRIDSIWLVPIFVTLIGITPQLIFSLSRVFKKNNKQPSRSKKS